MDEVGGLAAIAIEEILGSLEFSGLVDAVGGEVPDGHNGLSGSTLEHLGDVIVELVMDDGGDELLEPRLAVKEADLLDGVTSFEGHGGDLGAAGKHVSGSPVPGLLMLDFDSGLTWISVGRARGSGLRWKNVLAVNATKALLKRWRAVQCADVEEHLGLEVKVSIRQQWVQPQDWLDPWSLDMGSAFRCISMPFLDA